MYYLRESSSKKFIPLNAFPLYSWLSGKNHKVLGLIFATDYQVVIPSFYVFARNFCYEIIKFFVILQSWLKAQTSDGTCQHTSIYFS